jgi:hypothetical protein
MGSEFEIIECAIVAAAKNHNPTILNPDFLKINRIVPENGGWITLNTLTTDVFSQVTFKNGISITVEPQKLIFQDNDPQRTLKDSALDEIAANYIKVLPHVMYTAVGVNIKAAVEFESSDSANSFILDNLICPGPWKELSGGLKSSVLKLIYQIEDGRLNLSIEPALLQRTGEQIERAVVVVYANFHREISGKTDDSIGLIEGIFHGWEKDMKNFSGIVKTLLQVRGEES